MIRSETLVPQIDFSPHYFRWRTRKIGRMTKLEAVRPLSMKEYGRDNQNKAPVSDTTAPRTNRRSVKPGSRSSAQPTAAAIANISSQTCPAELVTEARLWTVVWKSHPATRLIDRASPLPR
jgi:hypothetical protein